MKYISLFSLISFLFVTNYSFSAQVIKVKGSSVLIQTDGENIQPGQLYYLISESGKKKGAVKIIKSKNGKSIAKLLKGTASKNWTLRLRTSKKTQAYTKPLPKIKTVSRKKRKSKKYAADDKRLSLGFVFGYNTNASDVKFLDGNGGLERDDTYTGTSFSYGALLDYKVTRKLQARGILGLHNFSTEDASNTQCGAVCRIDLSYISLDAWLRYYLTQGKYNIWGGAGIKMLFSPSAGATTALDPKDLGTELLPQVGGGIDFKYSDKLYIPVWGQYALHPASDTVSGNSISLYFGLGYRL